jgi:hypothetical protein
MHNDTHGQGRLCWLSQNRAEKRSCIKRLKAREIEYILLVAHTLMTWENDRGELTNRVKASFTRVGNSADSPAPFLKPSPATDHEAEILDV